MSATRASHRGSGRGRFRALPVPLTVALGLVSLSWASVSQTEGPTRL